ncbi:MAG: MoxR family ATPase [Gammaproteobacteria bacterium]|nr:MoxR family ATPase [Gammaproteobacteria bacterium]
MKNTQPEFIKMRNRLESIIIGQDKLIDRLLISLLTGGHVLLEGPPGLAKTTAVKAIAGSVHASFQRIQFTPDLMPSDLTGGEIFNPDTRKFEFIEGPVFNQIILADEINRAPPKIQSALLEAMQEHQVTVNGVTRKLPELFLVMATQNPLEQSGTYALPEAQLDRFLLHIKLDYPTAENELLILRKDRENYKAEQCSTENNDKDLLHPDDVLKARNQVANTHIDEKLEKYIVDIVSVTRNMEVIDKHFGELVEYGASPRASLALYKAASAMAYILGRDYVIPEDIHEVVADVLRHRIILNFNAASEGASKDNLITEIINYIPVP